MSGRKHFPRVATVVCAIPLAAYFLYFARGAVRAHFAADDPMNLGFYWRRGLAGSCVDVIALWRDSYRPMGAFFYLPIYDLFGMNPLPYRIAVLALIALNIMLGAWIAMRLTKSRAAAALTAAIVCAHASMVPVYYNTSQIYDVLAFFFTAAALAVYIRARERGGPTVMEGVAVAAFFLAAINSKEIAVAGAVWILAYELLLGPRPWKLTAPLVVIAIAGAFTAMRVFGPKSLASQEGYQLDVTAHRFVMNAKHYLNDVFYTHFFDKNAKLIAVFAIGTLLCLIARRRALWFAWVMVSTAALPVIFTREARAGASLYLPLLAVALWLSTAAAVFFHRWPIREWGVAGLIAVYFAGNTLQYWGAPAEIIVRDQQKTWAVLRQVHSLAQRPAHDSKVLFESNPFADWDIWFISELVWNDHSIDVKLANKESPAPDPKDFNWVFAFDGNQLRVVKSP